MADINQLWLHGLAMKIGVGDLRDEVDIAVERQLPRS